MLMNADILNHILNVVLLLVINMYYDYVNPTSLIIKSHPLWGLYHVLWYFTYIFTRPYI